MQLLARELNHPETTFVRRYQPSNPNTYQVRWFTPSREEIFCGHAIVACTQALHAAYNVKVFKYTTVTNINIVARVLPIDVGAGLAPGVVPVKMAFPSEPVLPLQVIADSYRESYAHALGIHSNLIQRLGRNSLMDVVIEVHPGVDITATGLKEVDPVKMMKASPPGTRSQVVTCRAPIDSEFDFLKRVFMYGSEDPATGSTYSVLVPYWSERIGKTELKAQQPSARGGEALLSWKKEGGIVEVMAMGVKVAEGIMMVPPTGTPRSSRFMSNL